SRRPRRRSRPDTLAVKSRMHSRATIHRETVWALELPPRDPDESGFVLAQLTISGAPGRALILDIAEEKIRTASTRPAAGAADASTRITTSGSRSVAKSIWPRRAGSPTTSMVIELAARTWRSPARQRLSDRGGWQKHVSVPLSSFSGFLTSRRGPECRSE